jgi:hypothetical protein
MDHLAPQTTREPVILASEVWADTTQLVPAGACRERYGEALIHAVSLGVSGALMALKPSPPVRAVDARHL